MSQHPPTMRPGFGDMGIGRTCASCGYNLLGLGPGATCPECGTVSLGIAGETVLDDWPCLKCGYSLKGLATSGVCPECGTGVARSLLGNLLKYSNPVYLAKLHIGALLVEVSLATTILLYVGMILASMFGGRHAGMQAIVQCLLVGDSVLSLAGWWMVSSPDPALLGRDPGGKPRVIIRITLAVSACSLLMKILVVYGGVVVSGGPEFARTIMAAAQALGLASLAAWVVSYFATMVYIRRLARRVPHPKLAGRAVTLLWLGPVLVACAPLGFVLVRVPGMVALLLGFAVGIAGLVWALFYVGIIDRLRVSMKSVRREAAEGR